MAIRDDALKEWTAYRCDIASGTRFRRGDCDNLIDVYHVAHVPDARRIVEDHGLRARIVYDESRLNRTRTHVCWVSANTWSDGSIYGTAAFAFKWSDLIRGRRLYWVEAMTGYRPHAYRFLLTDRAHSDLARYDPETDDGPLKQRGSDWYWNGTYCAEFMVEADLSLDLCWKIEFVSHNPRI